MEINFEANKYEFINLIKTVKRDGADINALLYKLNESDFFVAPYTATTHLSVLGGLCQHALNTHKNFKELVNKYYGDSVQEDTVTICGLLSCIANMNKYEITSKSRKEYCENGKQVDELGRFNWKAFKGYQIRDDHFAYGHFGQNSEYIIGTYIPLTFEESVCITNQKGNFTEEYQPYDMSLIYKKHPLASLLFIANFLATTIDERDFD